MEIPLETLETKLARLIQEWKNADALYVNSNNPEVEVKTKRDASFNLAAFVALHPELLKPTQDLPLVDTLLSLPTLIQDAQERFDKIDREYRRELSMITIDALSKVDFIDKDGKPRPASNERERDMAINWAVSHDTRLGILASQQADALRELQCTKARFEAAKLMVQLICHDGKR